MISILQMKFCTNWQRILLTQSRNVAKKLRISFASPRLCVKFLFWFRLVRVRLLIIIFFHIILLSCTKNTAKRVVSDKETGSTITLRNYSRQAFNEKGVLQWKLKAEETYYYADTDLTVMYNLFVQQFEKGKLKSNIKADKGEIDKKNNKMKVMGNVYLTTLDGKKVEAEELDYDMAKEFLTSDKKIVIRTKGTVLRGVGLEADNSMNKYKILRPEAVTSGGSNPLQKE
jgi:LPS export ABC transporter protein LptC